jgi:RHS repeat-associated protein
MNWTGESYIAGEAYGFANVDDGPLPIQDPFTATVPWSNGVAPTSAQVLSDLKATSVPITLGSTLGLIGVTFTAYGIVTQINSPGVVESGPQSISTSAWNIITSTLKSGIGNSLGGYVQSLDTEADYLGQLGENDTNVQSLWGFEVEQADNSLNPLAPYLTSVTDDSVATPGSLSLSFGRVYSQSISGRDATGTMGMGWSSSWDTSATSNSDGSVTINEPGGGQLTFEPDDRTSGAYFSPLGDTSTLSADGHGGYLLTAVDGTETDFTSAGLLNYMQDTDGNRITAGYTNGLLSSLTASTGQYINIAYNTAGLVSSLTDSDGRTTTYGYDSTNTYLTSVTAYTGQVTGYSYDTTASDPALNSLTTISFPGGTHQYFTYDSEGRLASTYGDNGTSPETFGYNLGQVSVTDGTGDTSNLYYNENDQIAKTVDALGNPTYYTYDGNYNLTSVTNAAGQAETYTYNTAGEVSSSTDFLGNTTNFTYGGPDNELTSMTDANGNTTNYAYSSSGNLLDTTYANGTNSSTTFNPLGEATSFLNQNGQPITYQYNSAGQVTQESFSDGTSYAYTYDGNGNLLTATDSTGTTTFTYAPTTEYLTEVAYPNSTWLKFSYNTAGQRTQMVDQTGFTTNYIYDTEGRLSQLTDGSGNVIVTYTYNLNSQLIKKVNGNGTSTTYTYDGDGNVLDLFNYATGGAVNSSFVYTYNSLGLETTETTIDGEWTYAYDADGQLTHAVFAPNSTDADGLTAQNMTYNYDAMGNRTSTIINGVTTAYVVNNMNEYTNVGGVQYTYDSNGNLLSDGTNSYSYNELNELTGMVNAGGTTSYTYNILGHIATSTQNGAATEYLSDPSEAGNLISTDNLQSGFVVNYVSGLGLVSEVISGVSLYYDFDNIGSVVGVTSASGKYVDSFAYQPFGAVVTSSLQAADVFQYAGELGAVGTGSANTVLMGARFYSSQIGRFLSQDPSGIAGGRNLYAYVFNRPTQLVDPLGLGPFQNVAIAALYLGLITGQAYLKGTNAGEIANQPEEAELVNPDKYLEQEIDSLADGIENVYSAERAELVEKVEALEEAVATDSTIAAEVGEAGEAGEVGLGLVIIGAFEAGYSFGTFLLPYLPPYLGGLDTTTTVNAQDPNALYGPAGYGTSGYVAGTDSSYSYLVTFENSSTATAPAQEVTIANQLPTTLSWSTFQLTGINFGSTYITIPVDSQSYQTTVLMTYDGETFDVLVKAGIHTATGQVYASFQSIDPKTGLPPSNPLVGFLPPEDGTGRGEGSLSYTISPVAGLATGTAITNVADITFDQGLTITTDQVNDENPADGVDPTKQALVTIDSVPPTSTVSALPSIETANAFQVNWSGSDNNGGSGVASYTIYVSTNGGAFTPWLINTNTTSGVFSGVSGDTYGFYSVASDNVGNVQTIPTAAQTSTTISTGFALTLGGQNMYLKLDSDGQHLDIWDSTTDTGQIAFSALLSQLSSIILAGTAGNDSVTIDLSNGDPLPYSGLSYTGSTGGQNTLNIVDTGDTSNEAFNVSGSSINVLSAAGTVPITYADVSMINIHPGSGSDTLTQLAQPGASLTYSGTTASDNLNVDAGTFTFAAAAAGSGMTSTVLGNVFIAAGAKVVVAAPDVHSDRKLMVLNSLYIAGSTNAWQGKLDLTGNDLIIHGGSLAQITNEAASGYSSGNWNGQGIASSTANGDTTHLTALGVILNTNGISSQALYSTFDGLPVSNTDVLVKYTYYGDTNLDGKVDGTDYTRVDNGYLSHLAGWFNGDFNYDGVVDGSDYTLIDNAFNTQGASLASLIASPHTVPAAQITEPALAPTSQTEKPGLHLSPGVRNGKFSERTGTSSFVSNIFSNGTPIQIANAFEGSVELSLQRKDVLDLLIFAR